MWYFIAFVFVGFLASFAGGLFGIGGGIIIMPVLFFIFAHTHSATNISPIHLAMNTSLVIIFINSIINSFVQYRARRINLQLLFFILPSTLFGVVIGSWLSRILNTAFVTDAAGFVFIFLALLVYYNTYHDIEEKSAPSKLKFIISGFLIGVPAAFLGIGGGSLLVPIFTFLGVGLQQVVGTAVVFSLITSFATLLTAAVVMIFKTKQLLSPVAMIDWYVVLSVVPVMYLGISLGSKCLHLLPQKLIKQLLMLLYFIIGILMIIL
jgi:uncharacterized membrane protein YfcA